MTPPTQSDARWEPPEWLKEVAARAIDDAAMGGLDGYRDEDPDRLPRLAKAAFRAVLVECPVLGLNLAEVEGLLDWTEGELELREVIEAVLSAALETGTLIAVPQDEQGRRELVERAAKAVGGYTLEYDTEDWLTAEGKDRLRATAERVLQALGLLPEQEQ